jgi:hypothetical protein
MAMAIMASFLSSSGWRAERACPLILGMGLTAGRACTGSTQPACIGSRWSEAAEHFGWFTMFVAMDASASSARTCSELDWKPEQAGLIADVDHPAYFAE